MDNFKKIRGARILSKSEQKMIVGSSSKMALCPSGCFSIYFSGPGNSCAIPSPSGEACFGTIVNDQCCL
tara:strand:- start:862 stop:1068 length:207 start_codon:yes stop_codon:yes gene_type:complete